MALTDIEIAQACTKKPISEIALYVSFGKSKTTQLLKDMEKKGVILIEGKGRGTKYIIK